MKTLTVFCIIIMLGFSSVRINAQSRHGKSTRYPTYKNLVMCGYQGWFRAPGDGSGNEWGHYGKNGKFDKKYNTIDFWPDVSDYERVYETSFLYPDGNPAFVFSSLDKSTTDLHFRWMQEYGIDGVFMQRFFRIAKDRNPDKTADIILRNAMEAAGKYGRAIAIMYDLSGLRSEGEDCSAIIEDWKMLVDELHVTNRGEDQNYLFHNGKPLVAIWGIGFPDRPYDIHKIGVDKLIDFLKNDPEYGCCSILLGVPTYFRDLNKDCIPDPYVHELIRSADIVLPWMVGRFTPELYEDGKLYHDHVMKDIIWCSNQGVDYVPVVYPGFSWRNLIMADPDSRRQAEYGAIPRLKGRFYWTLINTAVSAGAEMLYVAMFDEIDEGTAIFKVTDNPPRSEDYYFVDMDGMPSDHYLWLTGKAGELLREEILISAEIPLRKHKPNIIIILSDDQGYADLSFSAYAKKQVKTPNIDELAHSGMFFTDAHTSGMICAPTRAGLLTGRYQQRLGYWTGGNNAGVSGDEIMIPEYLRTKGYKSGIFGKWHVGSARQEWYPASQGFDYFYGFLGHGAHSYWVHDIPEDTSEWYNAIRTNDGPINDKGYLTDRITEETIRFIELNKSGPFFAYVCYNAVHWPMEAPHQDVNLFRTNEIPPGRQILLAMLKKLDDGVGRIIQYLKDNGLYENTLIFFLTDNGGAPNMLADNTPLKGFKNSAFEGGHRVPFMVSWPGKIKAGTTKDALVSSLDILPTILDITGINLPDDRTIDGISLFPVLEGRSGTVHKELFWHGANQRMAYRNGNWKWGYDRGREFLYYLSEDLAEENNLLLQKPDLVIDMKKRFEEWLSEMPDPDQGSKDWPLPSNDKK